MWLCVDPAGNVVTDETAAKVYEKYQSECDGYNFEVLNFYNLTDIKPNNMQMVIVEIK